MIIIGKIGKIHGLDGSIRLHSFTENPDDILKFKSFYLNNGHSIRIKFLRAKGSIFICKINSISCSEKVKDYVNQLVRINENELPKLNDGNYYFNQLVKMKVFLNQKNYGIVVSVNNHGAGDYLEIKTKKNKKILVPFITSHILDTNLQENMITLNPLYFSDDF
tara:strand:+ start:238 stop:729 length:492 start_codon:yes stop_codon:yes gene_type:complete